jgi:sporulation protein YlmC with PRC-barrel domain
LRDYKNSDAYSRDGREIGKLEDVYFDDEQWTIRYLVVRTGSWLTGRSVLLSPMAIERVQWNPTRFEFGVTQQQIQGAPGVDLARPVSRQWETTYAGYYGFPYYWGGPGIWGVGTTPLDARAARGFAGPAPHASAEDQHLRSAREVAGYHINARDGQIGHVEDFLVDDATWTIRYLLVDTSNWIGGRTVLVAPAWARHIDWARRQVEVDVTRQSVAAAPEFRPDAVVDQSFEEGLADFYRRPVRRA